MNMTSSAEGHHAPHLMFYNKYDYRNEVKEGMMNIDELKAQLAAITPGEWRDIVNVCGHLEVWANDCVVCDMGNTKNIDRIVYNDAAFIAGAPRIVRDLLAEVERLRRELEAKGE